MSGFLEREPGFDTVCVEGGWDPEQSEHGELVPPLSVTTTFLHQEPGKFVFSDYSRHDNSTRSVLERCIAALEGAQHCVTFSAGVAAVSTITNLLSSGDHIVAVDDQYGGTTRYFSNIASRLGISTTYVDAAADPDNVLRALRPSTKLVWMESPSNPHLKIVDIRKIAKSVHDANPDVLVVLDNTFLTPYFQRPLALGCDISVSSVSKYLNGHHDVIMGCASCNDTALYERLHHLQKAIGTVPSPTDCRAVIRSLSTLPVRMERHQANGLAVARFLETQPRVVKVLHPGLDSHPQSALAKSQSYGHSGMVSFYIDGDRSNMIRFLQSLRHVRLATSLGGCASTVAHVATMVQNTLGVLNKERCVEDNLIRLSIGLEDVHDITRDLEQALRAAFP